VGLEEGEEMMQIFEVFPFDVGLDHGLDNLVHVGLRRG
jgi:hypothetical protein